ncbi:MAG: ribonuclease P subunit p25 family protein [Promethearchaeota archaeon]
MTNQHTLYIKDRRDKERIIKDAIFSLTGAKKSVLIKGEGKEISTAVEVAEILKHRMYPSIEIANITLGSRPFYEYNRRNRNKQKNHKNIISKIEITLRTKTI